MRKGILYGIGVGPGDKELITLKAHRILRSVDIVAAPAADNGDSFANAIIADYIKPHQENVIFRFPIMAVAGKELYNAYDSMADQLRHHLDLGKNIALICEGDPLFYGSFAYILMRLQNDYQIDIIPGVSSVMTGAAMLKKPLVLRHDICVIIPATLNNDAIIPALQLQGTKILIKISRHWQRIYHLLKNHHMLDRTTIICHASLPRQKIMMAKEAKDENSLPYFALIYIYDN